MKIISFSRNFGHQAAVTAGIKYVTGSPYHLESQGCIEVSHKEKKKFLSAEFLNANGNDFNLVYICKKIITINLFKY